MSHDYDGLPVFLTQVEEQIVQFILGLRVEVAGWFVSEQYCGVVDQSAGYGDSLLLAAGELGRLVGQTLSKAEVFKQFHGMLLGIFS